jgi:ABC-type glycerol-3-phosphate transport system substrate-binding protein
MPENNENSPQDTEVNQAPKPRPHFRTEEVVDTSKQPNSSASPLSSIIDQTISTEVPQIEQNTPTLKKHKSKLLIVLVGVMLLLGILSMVAVLIKRNPNPGGSSGVGKKGEIVWWGVEEDESVVKPLIDEYQSKNPEVKVTYKKQSLQDYRERLTNTLAGAKSESPDIFEIHNSWVPMFNNNLYPLPNSVMSPDEYSRIFYPIIVSDLKTQAGIIGMPLQYDAITLYINEEIFTNAAVTTPTTWNEFRPLATKLTIQKEGNIIQSGASMGLTENVDYWPEIVGLMLLQNQANPAKPIDSQALDALTYYKKYAKEDNVWNKNLAASTTSFALGKSAMFFGTANAANEIVLKNPNLSFKTVPAPQLQKNSPKDPDVTYASYWTEGVWNRSVNKDLAWDFLHFISTPESLIRINQNRKINNKIERVYPRMDMVALQASDRILGSIVKLSMSAKSWYLADKTNDGESGINTQLNSLYAKTLNGRTDYPMTADMNNLASEVASALAKYGIIVK